MTKNTILIVDDEKEIADLLELYLLNEDYAVIKCGTACEALACIEREDIDLAILDIILPDLDGFSICRKIREAHSYPIIMLTSKVASIDKINGLALGADDYITKPFDPMELVARVKAQLRRYKKYNSIRSDKNTLVVSGITMELDTHRCWLDDKPLVLTPTESSILRILCQHAGIVVSSEALFHEIWGEEYFSKSTNPIPVHIRHLREKMMDCSENPRYIKTVWGVGYKIED